MLSVNGIFDDVVDSGLKERFSRFGSESSFIENVCDTGWHEDGGKIFNDSDYFLFFWVWDK